MSEAKTETKKSSFDRLADFSSKIRNIAWTAGVLWLVLSWIYGFVINRPELVALLIMGGVQLFVLMSFSVMVDRKTEAHPFHQWLVKRGEWFFGGLVLAQHFLTVAIIFGSIVAIGRFDSQQWFYGLWSCYPWAVLLLLNSVTSMAHLMVGMTGLARRIESIEKEQELDKIVDVLLEMHERRQEQEKLSAKTTINKPQSQPAKWNCCKGYPPPPPRLSGQRREGLRGFIWPCGPKDPADSILRRLPFKARAHSRRLYHAVNVKRVALPPPLVTRRDFGADQRVEHENPDRDGLSRTSDWR